MITFDEKSKVFYLSTNKTTYAIGIYKGKYPVHIYWGKRLNTKLDGEYIYNFPRHHMTTLESDGINPNDFPQEYSSFGGTDLRYPAFSAVCDDGSFVTKFIYAGYEIKSGKPKINGLPSTYAEQGDKVDTLTIKLYDELKKITLLLNYTVFEDFDAVTRNVKVINGGERFVISSVMSAAVDFYGMDECDFLHLDGTWARERHIVKNRLDGGIKQIESRAGTSSAYHNPFFALCDKNADEKSGNVYGFNLVYSGNFTAGAEKSPFNNVRAYIGINPTGFGWALENGESFETPEAVMVYSAKGLGGMSRIYHKLYRTRLCRGKYRDSERFVLINNWEATYFDFNEEKLVKIAEKAKEIGVDTFVLDDGWFGNRMTDNAGLGDWYENPARLPNGLKSLADKINGLGMHFGLWFEPEMVNPDSDLYRAHPDWILHTEGRTPGISRTQYTLDLSRPEVCDYIYDSVGTVLKKANIEYVKWDMNRYMSEVGSAMLPAHRQGEVYHRYMLGLYSIFERLVNDFPNVLFEGCASGGSRFDAGILHYMPQIWTSDDTDARERIFIQYGTSTVYPFSAISAHVSACPNHQVNRTTPFDMRCNVALTGQFGFELDLNKCTAEEIECAKKAVKEYKELREIFHKGDLYRLYSPFEGGKSVLEFVYGDKVALCIYSTDIKPEAPEEFIRLDGLDNGAYYSLDNKLYGGDYLMNRGLFYKNGKEYDNRILILNKVNSR